MRPLSGNSYVVTGTMSGTSLDGLDIAAVEFRRKENRWNYRMLAAKTISYTAEWKKKLMTAHILSGEELMELHSKYGKLTGKEINSFLKAENIRADLIASHGHTVFHQPGKGFTFQLGLGANIAAETGITTVADFRTTDVALGGQGAPLVPVGDHLLFPDYTYCLNLGGFANISFVHKEQRIAYDICPVNIVLNNLANKLGHDFDPNGEIGRQGIIKTSFLHKLNKLNYYYQPPPKSLGREWMEQHILPLMDETDVSIPDKLRTLYEHIAQQIAENVKGKGKILITGGGAFNQFLVELIQSRVACEVVIPQKEIVEYKEALIFAFLGLLRIMDEINCYASVTGALRDSCAGTIFA